MDIGTGTGRGQWGNLLPNFEAVGAAPLSPSARREELLLCYFRFVFIGEKAYG